MRRLPLSLSSAEGAFAATSGVATDCRDCWHLFSPLPSSVLIVASAAAASVLVVATAVPL